MSVLGVSWKGSTPKFSGTSPANKAGRRGKQQLKLPTGRLMLLVLLIGAAIEALLGVRLWAQLTGQSIDEGAFIFVFNTTELLVSPFHEYEPSSPIKETGILEIATLMAMQAYLIAVVAILLVIGLVSKIVRFWLSPAPQAIMPEPGPEDAATEPVGQLNEALPSP